ncbi:uncharacterized protein N7484_001547 [Penicillium longicatenatum]|uniref:uncharacterized protein n=1 Tax=Penicillium longicatenatum TaxID=1561947 RepID=UPI0025479A35|nr:uncharacterized protein N7484_001547 [Penicillium longicatenatum]KAJ5657898.1 hypothetical protein N7484_001547 [Penicillium longicatenatum]
MRITILRSILALCGFFLASTTAAELQRETACSSILIKPGDTCATLAAKCGITTAEFYDYNTDSSLCSSLTAGKPVCCSSGTLDIPPEASPDGLCYSYTLQAEDTCTSIADGYEITIDEIKAYNNATFDWNGCSELSQGAFICLSSGSPPMPVALPDAICGPQVPGTTRPSNMADLHDLNPCIATNCKCNLNVGQCYSTVDSNVGCATGTAARVSTSTAKAATTTSSKSRATLKKTKSTSTKPIPTSAKISKTILEKETTDSISKTESATTSTTSIAQITTASRTMSTSITPETSIVEITTASWTSNPSKPSSTHSTITHTNSGTTSAAKTTSTKSTSTTTSAAASTLAYNPWEVAMYSKEDCAGDYYLLSGINPDFGSDCLDIHGGLSSAFTKTGTWCRWYTDGGSTSTDCDAGTLETPASWYFTNAMCEVFPSNDCTNTNGTAQAYTSAGGSGSVNRCTNYADAAFKVSPWGSLWCSGIDGKFL